MINTIKVYISFEGKARIIPVMAVSKLRAITVVRKAYRGCTVFGATQ